MPYNLKLYNPDWKNRFLNEEYKNESTRNTYTSLLISIEVFESEKGKDLCNFSYADMTELFIGLKKKTFDSLNVAQTIIIKYIDWCIREGYSQTGINSAKLFTKEDLKKYAHQIAVRHAYITREKLFNVIDQLYNYIDKAIPLLFFEGAKGRSDGDHTFEEIRNLRERDLIPEINVVTLTRDNGEQRSIKVDPRTMKILVVAAKETEYYKANGEAKGRFPVAPLADSEYIIRMMESERSEDDKITANSINTRFKRFREWTGLKILTPTTIFKSGMLERCEQKEKEVGELTVDDYKQLYRDVNLDDRRYTALKEMYETYKKNKAPI